MDIDRLAQALNVLLTGMPIEAPLAAYASIGQKPRRVNRHSIKPYYQSFFDEKTFERAYLARYPAYSGNEARLVFEHLRTEASQPTCSQLGVFWLMLHVASHFLKTEGREIRCRHALLTSWRETVKLIGQSTLMCAFAASEDLKRGNKRVCDFSPYAKSDNLRLRQLLTKGMAENHYHLKGSAPAFLVSWVCLMNNIVGRAREFDNSQMRYQLLPQQAVTPGNNPNLHIVTIQAAYIRYFLWGLLLRKSDQSYLAANTCWPPEKEFFKYLSMPKIGILKLQNNIRTLRVITCPRSLDYSFDTEKESSPYAAIAGEHTFQYLMFRAIYSGEKSIVKHLDLFFLYLLITVKVRMELVQVNDVYGFDNFFKYQNRKEIFIERFPAYQKAYVRMAYASSLGNASIKSLEARVTPKQTVKGLHTTFTELLEIIDECQTVSPKFSTPGLQTFIRQSRQLALLTNATSANAQPLTQSQAQADENRVFHVLHFIKKEEKVNWDKLPFKLSVMRNPRHHQLRTFEVNKVSDAIVKWRRGCSRNATSVYGIDACSQEISCRPEVFAPSFRHLRQEMSYPWFWRCRSIRRAPPPLRITYHVGEDFLDIVDGLRAIDESVRFLGLTHGDRLGHALALGVDALEWYHLKGNTVILRKQDLLDNFMWFFHKICEYGIVADKLLRDLRARFSMLYHELYSSGQAVADETIEAYYGAWKLRGDHPGLYTVQGFGAACPLSVKTRNFNQLSDAELDNLRYCNKLVPKLVYAYHYDARARELGNSVTEFSISSEYCSAVEALQQTMKEDIARKGIAIETNPTSNYLIGTFRSYAQHPILRFYDRTLLDAPSPQQMFVSINTDDQGVFDTDLESEYAIMASAMEEAVDESGQHRYKPSNIYAWIDEVRAMGMLQSFKSIEKSLL